MKKRIVFILMVLSLCCLAGCKCEHTWQEPTCTEPKTCSECGEIDGEMLGHTWQEPTCTEPKTCSECGETEGNTLGHTWQDPTCTEPKTCSTCMETEGEPLGHEPGEWIADEPDYSSVCYKIRQYCSVCGEDIDYETIYFNTMHENGHFLFSPSEFSEKLDSYYSVLKSNMTTNLAVLDDNTLGCGIIYEGDCIAVIVFNDDDYMMEGEDKDKRNMSSMVIRYFTDDVSSVVSSMYGVLFACHPTLEESNAKSLAKSIVYAAQDGDYYEYDGIKHLLTIQDDEYWFYVSVLEK